MTQIAEKDVEGYRRARMAQMGVAIDGRPAHVHAYVSLPESDGTDGTNVSECCTARKIILALTMSVAAYFPRRAGSDFAKLEPRTS